jgi:hypothetical protein
MQEKSFAIRIAIFCFTLLSCFDGTGKKEIKQEIISPSGSHKIIEQSVDWGTATKHINKVFVLRSDLKIKKYSTPVLLTEEGNILNIVWKDDRNILITVESESSISYQVVKYYGTNIIVETLDSGVTDTIFNKTRQPQ